MKKYEYVIETKHGKFWCTYCDKIYRLKSALRIMNHRAKLSKNLHVRLSRRPICKFEVIKEKKPNENNV